MTAWSESARPLVYQPRGGGTPFLVHGTLARPAAEELIGGLEEQQRIFLTRWADLTAGGVTAPEKYDGVTDPGTTAFSTFVSERASNLISVNGMATADFADHPVQIGWSFVVRSTAGDLTAGLVDNTFLSGQIQLDVDPTGTVLDQPILFYLDTASREYSVHNSAVLYEGSTPKWMRAEVTG